MNIDDLLQALKTSDGPDRALDEEIAQVAGWKKHEEPFKDPATGEQKKRTLWLVPKKNNAGRLPQYTADIQEAWRLSQALMPGNVGGFGWEDGMAHARINDGPYVRAATPAIAICIAILSLHRSY